MNCRVDIPRDFRVAVTDEDIAEGKPADACYCPVALAVKRALYLPVDSTDVSVWQGMVTVWRGALTEDFDLGVAAQDWIESYDIGADVAPATFHARREDRRQHEQAVDAAEGC